MAQYRVLDIETIPDFSVWTPSAPKFSLAAPGIGPDYIRVFGETEAMRRPSPAHAVLEEAFPPPQAHRVVAMSWVDLSSDEAPWYRFESCQSLCAWSHDPQEAARVERDMLMTFGASQQVDEATLVTWNGRGFDLPVVVMRSLHYKLRASWYYENRDVRYRFSDAGHCDLMDWLGDYGAARNMKLNDIARLVGLPGKQGEVHGSNIRQQYEKGDDSSVMAEVARYCLSDAVQTALIFLRTRQFRGMISSLEYNRTLETFAASEQVQRVLPGFDVLSLRCEEES